MSTTVSDCAASDGDLCTFPSFALRCRVDDPDAPTEVTVYPGDADDVALATTWLSASLDDAVPLAEAR